MDMKIRTIIIISLLATILGSCNKENKEPREEPKGEPQIIYNTLITGYEVIWGMDFLPNGDLIFGERRGKLYRKSNEIVTEITGFPAVLASGQGGLLDIRVHPDYATNGWIYASFSVANPGSGGQLRLIRFKINNNQTQNVENLFATNGSNTWNGHYGSRIVFGKDKHVYLSVGEGGSGSYGGPNASNNNALNPKSDWGKIHRLTETGGVPADNPIIQGNTTATSVYSYGHRNPQGMAVHPATGEIWSTEHGPRGGDEVNIIVKGANYGWPAYSDGVNYDGTTISAGHNAIGITPPVYTWTPSIGVAGMAFITSEKFKDWKGNLLVGGLASRKLYRCVISNNKVTAEHILTGIDGRVRNVIQAPDGSIYVSVENPGRIIQIIPE
jgi:glucose/arabinose dehydrogenase